ncbi:putative pentatricopeptide repeat-containing protein At3g18840 [Impatiens glandulifera]|uniref:putative pentatricopeptide repeat-containing protein At3g18840 n=1 Tax=Impatiens glandulifera TaxID=253017 RepID=UPI001FB07795|nr:putative pentatricopeptide repeat-containing protein At3g18840 [Impatiens glandulifera]
MRSIKDGLKHLGQSIKSGSSLTIFSSNQIIRLLSKHGLIKEAHNLFDEMPERNIYSWNAIIWANIESLNLTRAISLFDSTPLKDTVTYNSILTGYVRSDGYQPHAFQTFAKMRKDDNLVCVDEVTLTTMLNLTAKLCFSSYGKQLHCCMIKTNNHSSCFSVSSLIDMYSKCDCFKEACQVFTDCSMFDLVSKNAMLAAYCREGEMEMALNLFRRRNDLNDEVSWNTLISGYVQNGYDEQALELFVCMEFEGFKSNEHTFGSLLTALASLRRFKHAKEVHSKVLKNGTISNPFVSSGIVDVYCKCGETGYAESVLARIASEKSFATTSMIVGYSSKGNMSEARRLFDSSSDKNIVMWTAMFSGYAKSHNPEAVFNLLNDYNSIPDVLILTSVLTACSMQAAIDLGKQVHAYILRIGFENDDNYRKLISTMIDMYSKSGNFPYAKRIFEKIYSRDTILYNVMIAAHAHHGYESESISLFEEMLERGLKPDKATFISLLSACRHHGLVEIGEKYFISMEKEFGLSRDADHYACMIDLYGRANQLEKTVTLMKSFYGKVDNVMLGTFLNACKMNKNIELAREVENELTRVEGGLGKRYVQLANVYAAEGKWDEMERIRNVIRAKEVKKIAGCSWIYVDGKCHVFTVGDIFHPEREVIFTVLEFLFSDLSMVKTEFLNC